MKTVELKVARIGNSRGVRLPAATLRRYHIGEAVLMEEREEGIVLRSADKGSPRLSWEDTAREMQASREDWSEWDSVFTGPRLIQSQVRKWARSVRL